MDGIQPYVAAPPRVSVPQPHAVPLSATVAKSPSDYVRAVRRRIWIILALGVPLSILGAVWVVRQPNVYRATAQITIEPPQFDPVLSTLLSHEIGRGDHEAAEKYVPNRIAMLRTKQLADQVVNDPAVMQGNAAAPEEADELLANLQTRQVTGTSHFFVTLEGTDPARTARLLMVLLEKFQKRAKEDSLSKIDSSEAMANRSLGLLKKELNQVNQGIQEMLRSSTTVGPGGKNIKEQQYELLTSVLMQRRSRLGELQQQALLTQSLPTLRSPEPISQREVQIAELEKTREDLTGRMRQLKRRVKFFNSDPAVQYQADKLQQVMEKLTRLREAPSLASSNAAGGGDPYEGVLETARAEIRADEDAARSLLAELQQSMPEHQKFLDMLKEQDQKVARIASLQEKLSEFAIVSQSLHDPVWIPESIPDPAVPVRPKRSMNLALVLILSFGLGTGLVCLLEHLDQSVKVPEHLTTGLTLPLFGVIPRIRRSAEFQRGGHLWTPGIPDSIEADAYRNLRASLVGLADKRGPIVSLLVTSAKAGEGKSTTALNLAATCAKAGERTLLMDVDLRRPSLGGVFQEPDEENPAFGLVDVLRGDLPWQRTVIRTDIPNLDFLPTGDTRAIPIEILGTLELRQLLIGLSSHYDRVILDGPAILGLADCRMLGRVVDAALLVVRSGAQELRPLQHAKAMLEQSHVTIAGVVFNGLYEDLKHWSSYGPLAPYGYGDGPSRRATPSDRAEALTLAGAARD